MPTSKASSLKNSAFITLHSTFLQNQIGERQLVFPSFTQHKHQSHCQDKEHHTKILLLLRSLKPRPSPLLNHIICSCVLTSLSC